MRTLLAVVLLLFQSTPAFEVVSIKPAGSADRSGANLDAAHFRCFGMPLRTLIFSAYRLPSWGVSGGPSWLDSDRWDIEATLPPNMPTKREELMPLADQMLQALLADRFKLTLHREMRDHPVYELVVAKGGLKIKPSTAEKMALKSGRGHLENREV